MIRYTIALLLFPVASSAQDVDCGNQVTQFDMNQCAYEAWQAADADLNRVYQQAIAVVQASDREYPLDGASEEDRLRLAQRTWVAFRDANCDAAGYAMRGGSAEPLLVNGCFRQMTEERIVELQSVLADY